MSKIITVDGPASSGKGTISQLLAKNLNWDYLDSGIFYRLLAWEALRTGGEINENQLIDFIKQAEIKFLKQDEKFSFYCNGQKLGAELRTEEIAGLTSKIAVLKDVRSALNQKFLQLAQNKNLIADGRDMGTVVFPYADLKIFLTASVEVRAERRLKQLNLSAEKANIYALAQEIAARDKRDSEREDSPLKPASDAVIIDTSCHTINQVYQEIYALLEKRILI